MNPTQRDRRRTLVAGAIVAVLGSLSMPAQVQAQGSGTPSAPSGALSSTPSTTPAGAPTSSTSSTAVGAPDPSPYYIGASQALTHDSNVYRIPAGRSDNYSSTSLLGGFDQRVSRQRLFGRASVTAHRYQKEDQLNNVSYNLSAGLAWETIENISGNLDVGLNRNLSSPVASSASAPTAQRNTVQSQNIDARARWGGPGLLTLEGGLGYAKIDYSGGGNDAADSTQQTASLALYYRPGGRLRLGVGARLNRTRTPDGLFDLSTAAFVSNTSTAKHLDLLADYQLTGLLSTTGRLSYTKQDNSAANTADFSGLTGILNVNWQPTGKTSVSFSASRDAGLDISRYSGYTVSGSGPNNTVITPVSGTFENNRVTDSLGVSVSYAATAKIKASAGVRYARAKLLTTNVSSLGSQTAPRSTDVIKIASLGVNYEATRAISAGCNVSHETRDVSGAVGFSYDANVVGCLVQITWR